MKTKERATRHRLAATELPGHYKRRLVSINGAFLVQQVHRRLGTIPHYERGADGQGFARLTCSTGKIISTQLETVGDRDSRRQGPGLLHGRVQHRLWRT